MPSPLDFCQNAVAQAGSELHYQLLFTLDKHKPLICALEYLYHKITQISRIHQSPEVAFESLNFWRRELSASNASPSHPAAILFNSAAGHYRHSDAFFESIASDLEFSQLEDHQAFEKYATKRYQWLIANMLPNAQRQMVSDLSLLYFCHEIVKNFKQDFYLAVWYLPLKSCIQFELVGKKKLTQALVIQFALAMLDQIDEISVRLKKDLDSGDIGPYHHYLLTKIAFLKATLISAKRRPQKFIQYQSQLSPLYLLYISSKTRLHIGL